MTADAYDAYGAEPAVPGSRPAVVVVDFQLAFTTDGIGMGGSDLIERAVLNAASVLGAARARHVPVFQTVVAWRADGADFGRWRMPKLRRITEGSRWAEVDPRVAGDGDVLLVKKWPSAFRGTPLGALLVAAGRDTVIVVGCTTSGCVRATIVDAFSEGFHVLVPEDGVGDQGPAPHEANLLDCGRRYCSVSTCEDITAYLEGLPA